jgi:hypothetical protein
MDGAIIVVWFAASRVVAASMGVAPNRAEPEIFWQLLPLDLLQTRLLESLWYLHSQPPLFNAFVGVVLKLPGDYVTTWRAAWVLVGLAFPIVIFACLRRAGAGRILAHAATFAICLNPTLLLYENFLLYTYPEALCVLIAFYALFSAPQNGRAWAQFGVVGSTLALFRATFHPLWALGIAGAAAWAVSDRLRRPQWLALVAPVFVGLLLIGKNGVMFDAWTSSSWYGMNVAKLAVTAMLGETPRLVEAGIVSRLFAIGPFQPVSRYPASMINDAVGEAQRNFGEIPALVLEQKANGQPNFNHLIYRDVSRQLAAESVAAARARPRLFDETVSKGLWYYVQPASLYIFLSDNHRRVKALDDVYRNALYPGGTFLVVQIGLLVVLLTSGWVALFESARWATLRPAAGYVFVTVLWVSIASNLAEYGENMRLRFTLDPLMTVWCLVLVIRIARRPPNGGRAFSPPRVR